MNALMNQMNQVRFKQNLLLTCRVLNSSSGSSSTSDIGSHESSSSSSSDSDSESSHKSDSAKKSSVAIRDQNVSQMWGKYRFTPTKTGWQITCPDHASHGKAHCAKTRSNAIQGEASARRMLKAWALWGAQAASKEDREKKVWQSVIEAERSKTLPSEDALDAQQQSLSSGSSSARRS